jgi:hypothetical protein
MQHFVARSNRLKSNRFRKDLEEFVPRLLRPAAAQNLNLQSQPASPVHAAKGGDDDYGDKNPDVRVADGRGNARTRIPGHCYLRRKPCA